jgi:hypothetical protein
MKLGDFFDVWLNTRDIGQPRFIGQRGQNLAKMDDLLANSAFGEWIGTALARLA